MKFRFTLTLSRLTRLSYSALVPKGSLRRDEQDEQAGYPEAKKHQQQGQNDNAYGFIFMQK